ncbi:hypothetical protein HPP92_018154 [Vanilla planifolia]|uniref:Vacuolar protein sorting-associated protein 13 VPS13 adaptor binding domain-containing protein n=1 Tax=Vanilla planifolia TaxID=51239 RepID=A0A835QDJ3_VANPL|nr:hypothetical protein HPP92_018154 [Vanilla planifolia]
MKGGLIGHWDGLGVNHMCDWDPTVDAITTSKGSSFGVLGSGISKKGGGIMRTSLGGRCSNDKAAEEGGDRITTTIKINPNHNSDMRSHLGKEDEFILPWLNCLIQKLCALPQKVLAFPMFLQVRYHSSWRSKRPCMSFISLYAESNKGEPLCINFNPGSCFVGISGRDGDVSSFGKPSQMNVDILLSEISLDVLLYFVGKLDLAGPYVVRQAVIFPNCCKLENHTSLTALFQFQENQNVVLSQGQSSAAYLRHIALESQLPDNQNIIKISLLDSRGFSTSPISISLSDVCFFAWRTRLASLEDSRIFPGPIVVIEVAKKNEHGDTVDDSKAVFEALDFDGGSRRTLMSLTLGNFLLSLRPQFPEYENNERNVSFSWSEEIKGEKAQRVSGMFDKLNYKFRKALGAGSLKSFYSILCCPITMEGQHASDMHFLIQTIGREVPLMQPQNLGDLKGFKTSPVAMQVQKEIFIYPTIQVHNLLQCEIFVSLVENDPETCSIEEPANIGRQADIPSQSSCNLKDPLLTQNLIWAVFLSPKSIKSWFFRKKVHIRCLGEKTAVALLDLDILTGFTEISLEAPNGSGTNKVARLGVSLEPCIYKIYVPTQLVSFVPRFIIANESMEPIIIRPCYLQGDATGEIIVEARQRVPLHTAKDFHLVREINIDKVSEWKPFFKIWQQKGLLLHFPLNKQSEIEKTTSDEPHKLEIFKVGFEIYADGSTRVLRFCEATKRIEHTTVEAISESLNYVTIVVASLGNVTLDSIITQSHKYNHLRVQSTKSKVKQVKYSSIILQPIDLKIDEETLMKLAPFWRSSSTSSSKQSQQFYFRHFEIHPIKVSDKICLYCQRKLFFRLLFASIFDDTASSSLDVFFDPSDGSISLPGVTQVTGFHQGILRLAMDPSLLGAAVMEGGR